VRNVKEMAFVGEALLLEREPHLDGGLREAGVVEFKHCNTSGLSVCVPDAAQREATSRSGAPQIRDLTGDGVCNGPGCAAHHQEVLRCARDTDTHGCSTKFLYSCSTSAGTAVRLSETNFASSSPVFGFPTSMPRFAASS